MELTKKALLISSMQITYQKERKKAFKKRKETKTEQNRAKLLWHLLFHSDHGNDICVCTQIQINGLLIISAKYS
jgi:hypothetical protein